MSTAESPTPDADPLAVGETARAALDHLRGALRTSASARAEATRLEGRLQAFADATPTVEERAVAIVERVLDELGAVAGVAMRTTADSRSLELVGAAHLPDDLAARYRQLPLAAALPAAEVARTGRPCYCESAEAVLRHYPAMRDAVERMGLHALAAIPVRHLGRVRGSIVFGFDAPRRFTPAEKVSLRALGGRYARALHQARRYFAEHDARTVAESARRAAEEGRALAEAADRRKGDFLAVVSHELRTPLQAIIGYAELLTRGVVGEMPARQREFVDRIGASGLALLHIVENLLGFSAAQVGKLRADAESFDAAALAREVVDLAQPLAGRKGLTLRAELPPSAPFVSDPRKVRQILTNLVGNAIKFTEAGEVVVAVAPLGTRGVVLAVRDTGVGVAPAELPRLFEPFWRSERQPANASGTGLGLSIVRQLARLLGGDVTAESAVGVGSTFRVTLPPLPALEAGA